MEDIPAWLLCQDICARAQEELTSQAIETLDREIEAKIINNEKGRYFIFNPKIGDKYDESVWVNSYIDNIMSPIKEKMILALKELKNR